MKIQVKRLFKYTFDNVTTHKIAPGVYDVPADVPKDAAILAIEFGAAVRINEPAKKPVEKKAPENKAVTAPENKSTPKKTNKRAKKAK